MRFREPLLACGWRGDERGESRRPGHGGTGGFRSPEPGRDLSEVPAVSANYLAGASAARERPILLRSICFFIASAPFLTLQSLLWLVSEMPRRVLTLRGGRGEESRHPPPSPFTHLQKKKKSPQCSSSGSLQILRRPVFTDLNDLGGKNWVSERLVVAFLSIEEQILSGPPCRAGGYFLRSGVCPGYFVLPTAVVLV